MLRKFSAVVEKIRKQEYMLVTCLDSWVRTQAETLITLV